MSRSRPFKTQIHWWYGVEVACGKFSRHPHLYNINLTIPQTLWFICSLAVNFGPSRPGFESQYRHTINYVQVVVYGSQFFLPFFLGLPRSNLFSAHPNLFE